jgi:hypothetical protein
MFPMNFIAFPFLNMFARAAGDAYGKDWTPETTGVWIGLVFVLATSRIAALAYS